MNAHGPAPSQVEQQARALLDLVESDRDRQCAQVLGEAHARAAALHTQAHAEARARMRAAFAEQRQRQQGAIAAAQARLATQRRLHRQQRTAAWLRLAWEQLPGELTALWQQPGARPAWVAQVLASARAHLPNPAPSGWRIVHAPGWPLPEQQALADALTAATGTAPRFEAEPSITAGLKVMAQGNVIDGTLAGLLADRAEIEARLLQQLESAA